MKKLLNYKSYLAAGSSLEGINQIAFNQAVSIRKVQFDIQGAVKSRQQQYYTNQQSYGGNGNNCGGYKGKNYDLNYKGKQSSQQQQQQYQFPAITDAGKDK